VLTCPYCRRPFTITWKRYACAFRGRHRCGHCRRVSRLVLEWWFFIPRVIALMCGGMGAFFAVWSLDPHCCSAEVVFVAGGLALLVPVDRMLDNNFGTLVKTGGEEAFGDPPPG
jgi:hypothetical protein